MATRFLYFDLGNVLLTFSNHQACAQMAEVAGVEVDRVARLVLGPHERGSLLWRFEAGELSDVEFYAQFCTALGVSPDRTALARAASDMFAPIETSRRLVEDLATGGQRLGVLSNTNPLHWQFVMDGRFPFLHHAFELAVTSFEAKSMKPDRRIFEVAIDRAGVRPEEIFFVDDREENVAGARAVGLDAVVYRDHPTLVADLAQRGCVAGR